MEQESQITTAPEINGSGSDSSSGNYSSKESELDLYDESCNNFVPIAMDTTESESDVENFDNCGINWDKPPPTPGSTIIHNKNEYKRPQGRIYMFQLENKCDNYLKKHGKLCCHLSLITKVYN